MPRIGRMGETAAGVIRCCSSCRSMRRTAIQLLERQTTKLVIGMFGVPPLPFIRPIRSIRCIRITLRHWSRPEAVLTTFTKGDKFHLPIDRLSTDRQVQMSLCDRELERRPSVQALDQPLDDRGR